MRSTLRQYRGDRRTYPASLRDLVADGYLRTIPVDPITRSRDTWRATYEYPGTPGPGQSARFVVVDVHSGSAERAIDGTPYSSW
jgi:general secretion pathway protein G